MIYILQPFVHPLYDDGEAMIFTSRRFQLSASFPPSRGRWPAKRLNVFNQLSGALTTPSHLHDFRVDPLMIFRVPGGMPRFSSARQRSAYVGIRTERQTSKSA